MPADIVHEDNPALVRIARKTIIGIRNRVDKNPNYQETWNELSA